MIKYSLKRLFEVGFQDVIHQLVEPCSIRVIYEAIIVDAIDLVDKQADQSVFVLNGLLLHQQAALDNAWKVPQVEGVVGLGWSWKQVQHGFLIHLELKKEKIMFDIFMCMTYIW